MSRRNKVNPDHYTGAGRLAPDDLARERRKQTEPMFGLKRGADRKPTPPWMAHDAKGKAADEDSAPALTEDVAVISSDAPNEERLEAERPQATMEVPTSTKATTATTGATSAKRRKAGRLSPTSRRTSAKAAKAKASKASKPVAKKAAKNRSTGAAKSSRGAKAKKGKKAKKGRMR